MKKALSLICIMALCVSISITNVRASEISVFYNNAKIDFDVNPIIINDRTMVAISTLLQAIGGVCQWDDKERKVTISYRDNPMITLYIDKNIAKVVGNDDILLDTAPIIKDGRTLVPLRFIAESFDKNVYFDSKTSTVYIEDRIKENIYSDTSNNLKFEIIPELDFGFSRNLSESQDEKLSAFVLFVYNEPSGSLAVPARQEVGKFKVSDDFDKGEFVKSLSGMAEEEQFTLDYYDNENDIYFGTNTLNNMGRKYIYKTYIHIKVHNKYAYISMFLIDETRLKINNDTIIRCLKSTSSNE